MWTAYDFYDASSRQTALTYKLFYTEIRSLINAILGAPDYDIGMSAGGT